MNILDKIVAQKRIEVAGLPETPISDELLRRFGARRDFLARSKSRDGQGQR
jgi:hypothetical protein